VQRALLRTAQEVAKGLAYVHSLGVVHADLKPANVLLQTHRGLDRRGYTARLADFGAHTLRSLHLSSSSRQIVWQRSMSMQAVSSTSFAASKFHCTHDATIAVRLQCFGKVAAPSVTAAGFIIGLRRMQG